jgi:C-terminal processing protease CtpA/Prc
MIRKYLSVFSLSIICAFSISILNAQESKAKTKLVVIEKTIDKDGNVVIKKVVKEGKEAKHYIKEIEIEKEVQKENSIRIVKKDENGNEEVMEWSGSGEMPEDFEKWMIDEDGEEKHVEVTVQGVDSEADEMLFFGDEMEVKVISKESGRKAQLGVMIEETTDAKGVLITEIIEDSAAEKAGLQSGDVITKINDAKITDPESLLNQVKDREAGEVIELSFLRNGEEYMMKVALQEFTMFEAIELDDDDIEDIIIIKKKKK